MEPRPLTGERYGSEATAKPGIVSAGKAVVAGEEGWLLRQSYLAEALFWLAYYVGRRQLSIAGKPHET